jgi:RHH-type proline utilization regulon transcriptional repressor/proline dehydrogenase/delta 1-pyrroline-5-carboxylate dehydrogenase
LRKLGGLIAAPGPDVTVLCKGEAHTNGWFVAPAIFAVQDPMHRLMQEELFGPVLAVMQVQSFDAALDIAVSTAFALSGGIYSRTPSNLELARQRFRVGNLYLNLGCTGSLVGRQPFGGFGMSGMGSKAGGANYLLQFAAPRCITENTMRCGFTPEMGW